MFGFRFDDAIGDYTTEFEYTQNCTNFTTDEVIAKNAYEVDVQMTLQVLQSVRTSEDDLYATEMYGQRTDRAVLSSEGEVGGCEPGETTQDDMRVVRIDPPTGETVMETGGVGE